MQDPKKKISFSKIITPAKENPGYYNGQHYVTTALSNLASRGLITFNHTTQEYVIAKAPENIYEYKVRSDQKFIDTIEEYLINNFIRDNTTYEESHAEIKLLYQICQQLKRNLSTIIQPKADLKDNPASVELIVDKHQQELLFSDAWLNFAKQQNLNPENTPKIKKLIEGMRKNLELIFQDTYTSDFNLELFVKNLNIINRSLALIYNLIFTRNPPLMISREQQFNLNTLLEHHNFRVAAYIPIKTKTPQLLVNYNMGIKKNRDGSYQVYQPLSPIDQAKWHEVFTKLKSKKILIDPQTQSTSQKSNNDKIWQPIINQDFLDKNHLPDIEQALIELINISSRGFDYKLRKLISTLESMQANIKHVNTKKTKYNN